MPQGADLTAFWKNPVSLPAHDYRALPIGTVTSINVTTDGIKVRWRWNSADEQGQRYQQAWNGGFLRALSIGFRPLESTPNAYGGYDFTRWELLEVSLVAVPANPEATRQLAALGLTPPLELPADLTPEQFVGLIRNAVTEAVRDHIQTFVRRAIDKARGRVADEMVLELADPVSHVQRAHANNVMPNDQHAHTVEIEPADVTRIVRRLLPDLIRQAVVESITTSTRRALTLARGRVD